MIRISDDVPGARRLGYPFAAIVGMSAAKRALMLLAIDPGLKGVLISGPAGSAKSVLARSFQTLTGDSPFVELPLNATEDQLLGCVDLEATISAGERRSTPGALARADGGALYVDCVNLLDAASADNIASALEDGVVRLEREGISESFSSRFGFIGTSDPAEGEVSANLRDRVGLLVETAGSATEGPNIIERVLEFDKDPAGFIEAFEVETAAIKAHLESACLLLPHVTASREDINRVAQVAMRLGVEGNRADIFSVRAARASAALAGRDSVVDEDIITAIKLALLPRATRLPANAQRQSETQEAQPETTPQRPEHPLPELTRTAEAGEPHQAPIGDLIIEAIASPQLNEALPLEPSGKQIERARAGSGKRARTSDSSRGRYAGVSKIQRGPSRIAVDATLRAAAPYQIARRAKRDTAQSGVVRLLDDDVPARESRVKILPDDLRFKRFKRRSGALFIFAVDASGSMAVNRMAQAKGAIARLLGDAYLHRDKVALISFRGSQAEVLLAPTRSVELAKRLVEAMPTGGGTPVSAGLVKALDLARVARLLKVSQTLVVLFTDGRANVELRALEGNRRPELNEQLRDIGRLLQSEGINSLVVDTKSKFVSRGEGAMLAQTLGARYLYLPNSEGQALYEVIGKMADTGRASDGI